MFIVAACNPHRGNSMASLGVEDGSKKDKWVRGTYYVRKLHPTLRFLMWDYGSLDEHQEKEYINTKMKMLNQHRSNSEVNQTYRGLMCTSKCTIASALYGYYWPSRSLCSEAECYMMLENFRKANIEHERETVH